MWINKNTTPFTRIVKAQGVTIGGVQHPRNIFTKWSEAELNAIGLYSVAISGLPDRRYYTAKEVEDFTTDVCTITYTATDRPLADVQAAMIKDLEKEELKRSELPLVDSGLGYKVKGSRDDLDSFERGSKRGLTELRDSNGVKRTVTPTELVDIATAIETNGLLLFNTKWIKFDEIKALTTVADCILYEATPYDYPITVEDVILDNTLVEGTIIVKHTNNVTEW